MPDCAPTDIVLSTIVSLNLGDIRLLRVSVRSVVPITVVVSPARVNVPELEMIVTCPCTVTPLGRVATVAG